jgi:NTP pyrophosphatase (non-canonical NTP hydrolase)
MNGTRAAGEGAAKPHDQVNCRAEGDGASGRGASGRTVGMPDQDVAELRVRLRQFADRRDWQPFHTPKNLATALVVEAAELAEIFQWLTPEQSAVVMDDPDAGFRVRDEIADVLAYLLQLADACGVDPLVALAEKIDRNELRFPAPRGSAQSGR